MKVVSVEPIPVSVPYSHREVSSQVQRDGVTDILVRIEADNGLVGWGESSSGADACSVEAAIRAIAPMVVDRDPWHRDSLRHDMWFHGLWQFRAGTGNFAWAGIDMALWDLCGKDAGQPLHRLLGGAVRASATYFYYLSRGDDGDIAEQCRQGLELGFGVYYLKVGLDDTDDLRMVAAARSALGAAPLLRLDVNGVWTPGHALRMLTRLADYDIDFVEQPVRDHPVEALAEVRRRSPIPVAANEGMWSEAQAYDRIVRRQADVFCFSPQWVGSLAAFHRLSWVAHHEGLQVCKHTHGELGLAAAAAHHVVLALPNGVEGHQQTAHVMTSDILREPLPIVSGPEWGVIEAPGIGVEVDDDAVRDAALRYRKDGQFRPWQPDRLAAERR